jgi:TM2 domain-containing membrane protein YozV
MEPNKEQTSSSKTDAVINDLRINPEWLITFLLAFFLGVFGIHRFYVGKIWTGILMLITLGGLGIWATIDLIIILVGKFTRKDGTVIPVRIPITQ